MPKESKNFQSFLAKLTPEQMEEANKKAQLAIKRVFEEGLMPYQALDMPYEVVEHIYGEAYRYYTSGLFKKAQQFFELLIFLDPTESKFVFGAAACLQMQKYYAVAIETYQFLTQMTPENPLPYFYMYECHMQLNEFEKAQKDLERVITLAAADPHAYEQLGEKAKIMLEGHRALDGHGEEESIRGTL